MKHYKTNKNPIKKTLATKQRAGRITTPIVIKNVQSLANEPAEVQNPHAVAPAGRQLISGRIKISFSDLAKI